jgi:hypothetical protein
VGGPSLPPGLEALDVKRRGVWRHPLRNRRVARLGRLLRAGDDERLRHQFPAVAQALDGTAAAGAYILVENLEHGLALARGLPGWPLIAGPSPTTNGFSAADVEILLAGETARRQRPPFAIVTAAGMQTLVKPAPGVVIRADGGVGLPALGAVDLLMPATHPGRRMLLVDFDDRHHPVLRRKSRRRREAYARRGSGSRSSFPGRWASVPAAACSPCSPTWSASPPPGTAGSLALPRRRLPGP